MFTLETPKGQLVKVKMPNGEMKMEIRWKEGFGPEMTRNFRNIQEFIDSECLELCDEFVPKDTGILKQSGIMHTMIGSGEIRYRTVYARRWYYMPAAFQEAPQRGNYWFERMKQQYKDRILAGAKKIASGG